MTNTQPRGQSPTVAEVRADFLAKRLAKGYAPVQAEYDWQRYASGPGYTYLSRIAKESR